MLIFYRVHPIQYIYIGVDKIPEYLEIYLENTKNYAEEFRLNLVRKLRATVYIYIYIYIIIYIVWGTPNNM